MSAPVDRFREILATGRSAFEERVRAWVAPLRERLETETTAA